VSPYIVVDSSTDPGGPQLRLDWPLLLRSKAPPRRQQQQQQQQGAVQMALWGAGGAPGSEDGDVWEGEGALGQAADAQDLSLSQGERASAMHRGEVGGGAGRCTALCFARLGCGAPA